MSESITSPTPTHSVVPDTPPPAEAIVERPSPLTSIARSWAILVAIGYFVVKEITKEDGREFLSTLLNLGWPVIILFTSALIFSVASGVIMWRTTQFIASDTELRVDRRFISHSSQRVAYAKIQSIDISRPLAARLLGLSSIEIDAGADASITLAYLTSTRADSLRDHILTRMRSLNSDEPTSAPAVPTDQERHPVFRVSYSTLLLGTFVSQALPWMLLTLSFVGLIAYFEHKTFFILLLPYLVGWASFLYKELIANAKFQLETVPDGLRVSQGLFSLQSRTLRADRIQAVEIRQDFLQRLVGLYRVKVTVLGDSAASSSDATSGLVLPYGAWDTVLKTLDTFWPGINIATIPRTHQPRQARWLTPLAFRRVCWGYDEQTLIAEGGWLSHYIHLVPHLRMQSLSLSQGPLQRLLGLAVVNIHITDGPISMEMKHMPMRDALTFLFEQRDRARTARETPGDPSYLRRFAPPTAPAVPPPPPVGQPS